MSRRPAVVYVIVMQWLMSGALCSLLIEPPAQDANAAPRTTREAGGAAPFVSPLIINEYLAAPPAGLAGDANGDGVRSAGQDEFVELVNTGVTPLDISGYSIIDADSVSPRFTFPSGKVIPPGEAAVVFGGGTPTGPFGNCKALGLVFAAGSAGLSLNDTGDSIIVRDNLGVEITRKDYPPPASNTGQSITLSPDISGVFVAHSTTAGSGGRLFSPGTKVDGTTFTPPVPFVDSVSPDVAVVGSGVVAISVLGGAFQSGAQVRVDASPVSTVFTSSVQLTANVPTGATSVAGSHSIMVQNPSLVTSNSATFTVLPAVGINELLADPSGASPGDLIGDANGDGIRDSSQDEFIEIVNRTSLAAGVGGFSISDLDQKRFTFPGGTVIPAGEAAVIFGGGNPTGEFGNAKVNGLIFTSPLSLNNSGDVITLKDASDNIVETVAYGSEGGQDESLNRSPEPVSVHFAKHSAVSGAGASKFSPGTHVDGTPFTIGPRITSISPDLVPLSAPPFDLMVDGTGFDAGCSLRVDSTALVVLSVSSTSLTARVPASITAIPGAHQVRAVNPGGNRSNVATLLVVPPPPVVLSAVPRLIQQGSGDFSLFVLGSNFDSASRVLIEGTQVATVFDRPHELRATVPASFTVSLGERHVRVRNIDGQESADTLFEVVLPAVRVASISPTEVAAGGPDLVIAVKGTNYTNGSSVLFDRAPMPTTFVSATELRCVLSASLTLTPGTHSVMVQNVDGSLSNEVAFRTRPDPPLVRAIDPPSLNEGSGDTRLTISGEKFQAGAVVRVLETKGPGEALESVFVGSTAMEAVLPARLAQTAGNINLRVENPDFGFSNAATVRVFIKDPLVINEYLADPPPGAAGDANGDGTRSSSQDEFVEIVNRTSEPIDISGFRLSDADAIRHVFAGNSIVPPFEAAVVFGGGSPKGKFGNVADNKLVFKASTGGLSLNNGGDVIRLEDAAGRVIQEIRFSAIEGGARQSLNRDPDSDGAVFTLHSLVAFDKRRLFSPGARASGTPFTTKPVIAALEPSNALAGSSAITLAISGEDFLTGATVLFGETILPALLRSSSQLEVQVAASLLEEAGAIDVRIRNPLGELSSPARFLITGPPPRLTKISPDITGTGAAGLELSIEGEHFQQRAAVTIDGKPAETRFVSASLLKAILPASLSGQTAHLDVRVENEDGNRSNALTLTIENGPLITRLSRSRAKAGKGPIKITIGGVAFKQGIVLLVDGAAVTTEFLSDAEFSSTIPAELTAMPGKLALQAQNANGGRSNTVSLKIVQ